MIWIIAYDVSDDRRRSRVSRLLQHHGVRIQRSVFECDLDGDEAVSVLEAIEEMLGTGTDVLHAFPLCDRCSSGRRVVGDAALALDEPFVIF